MTTGYRRELGPFSVASLVAGSMVGSGIFLVSADIARLGGTGGFILGAWGLASLLTVLGALSYGELAALYQDAGGPYVYLKEAFGPAFGFLFGWTAFLVIDCGGIAAVAVGFGKYLGAIVPAVNDSRWLVGPWHFQPLQMGSIIIGPYDFGLTPARLAGLAVIALLTFANTLGVKLGARIQNVFTAVKVASLLALVVLGLSLAPSQPATGAFIAPAGTATLSWLPALMLTQVGALFAADGWYYVTYVAAEVKDPRRTLPVALLAGTTSVLLLYFLANIVYLKVLGPAAMAAAPEDRVGSEALRAILGPVGERVMALGVLVAMFGYLNGAILSPARLYQAMAADGLFVGRAAALNRNGVPAFALLAQAVWAGFLTLTGSFDQLLDFVVFATLAFYGLCVTGLIVLRFRRPNLHRSYRVPFYPLVPLAYLAGVAAILGTLLVYRPSYTWPGLVLALAGVPVYAWLKRRARKT
jgi:APA family basic amino acid/polyamine antiporter